MHIVQANFAYDAGVSDPEALLASYPTLTGWSEALLEAGAARVSVVQRFSRNARVARCGVDYHLCADANAPDPRAWQPLGRTAACVARLTPDVVHVNGFRFPAATLRLRHALLRNCALVIQHHGGGPPTPRVGRALVGRGLASADTLLFSAAALAAAWRDAGLIKDHQRIDEVMEASTSLRRLDGAPRLHGDPAVVWLGRLTHDKDPLTVLDGFRQALDMVPGLGLTMASAIGECLPQVERRLHDDEELRRHVRLIGRVPHPDVAALMSGADIFVAGSRRESSGYALMEALACGLVPIVTDIPSFRVLTDEGRLGALWAPGDARSLAAALVRLARTDRTALSEEASRFFVSRFGWPAIGARAMAIYREVAARRLKPPAGTPALPGVAGTPAPPGVAGTPGVAEIPALPGVAGMPAPPRVRRSGVTP